MVGQCSRLAQALRHRDCGGHWHGRWAGMGRGRAWTAACACRVVLILQLRGVEACLEVDLQRASLGIFSVSVIAHVTSTQKDC